MHWYQCNKCGFLFYTATNLSINHVVCAQHSSKVFLGYSFIIVSSAHFKNSNIATATLYSSYPPQSVFVCSFSMVFLFIHCMYLCSTALNSPFSFCVNRVCRAIVGVYFKNLAVRILLSRTQSIFGFWISDFGFTSKFATEFQRLFKQFINRSNSRAYRRYPIQGHDYSRN